MRKLEERERELSTKASADYGPSDQFAGLADQCFEWKPDGAEFTYEMCPFKNAAQKPTNGGSTSVGTWQGFGNGHAQMLFTNGQHCWNGPSRSLTVDVECGEANRILQVDEPEVCKYTARFVTPAACTDAEVQLAQREVDSLGAAASHDEL